MSFWDDAVKFEPEDGAFAKKSDKEKPNPKNDKGEKHDEHDDEDR